MARRFIPDPDDEAAFVARRDAQIVAPGPVMPAPEVEAELKARITYNACLRHLKTEEAVRILTRSTGAEASVVRGWIARWRAEVDTVVRESGDIRWLQREVAELYVDCKMRVMHYNMLAQTTMEPEKCLGEARREAELMLKLQERLATISEMLSVRALTAQTEQREKTALEMLSETAQVLAKMKTLSDGGTNSVNDDN